MKKISLIILLMATILTSLAAYSTIDNEPANTSCPGVPILELENVSTHKIISANMSMKVYWDADYVSFNTGAKGTLKISITADKPIGFRVGSSCGQQDYYYTINQTSYQKSIEVDANKPIHIMVYDWDTGAGYDYKLDIEFIPEESEATNDDSNLDNDNTDTIDNVQLDTEPANTSCPGVTISELENISIHKTISADMSMKVYWDADYLSFNTGAKGVVKISITADKPIGFRVGSACGQQDYYYTINQTSYQKSIEVDANKPIHIMVYDWDTGAGYNYKLDIEFIPEAGEESTDNDTTDDSSSDTSDNSTQDTNTDYTSQNFTEDESGAISHSTIANEVIGTTKGNFSVNQGAANYSLDISVPSGRAGMEPKISLDYNSNAGDGYLGKGWGIGGLSVISRCPSTKAVDNIIRGVKLDKDDQYCLNGQRLIKTSDNPNEGNAEYRTEIDSYSKIVSYESNDYGPAHWKVWTKSGLIYRYGYNGDADIKIGTTGKSLKSATLSGSERIISWAVDTISDRTEDGNNINFHYNNEVENERYIESIDYIGGEIVFGYDDRNKIIKGYSLGEEYQITKKLETVTVKDKKDGAVVRSYDLMYRYSYSRDILRAIKEMAGTTPLKTLRFEGEFPTHIAYTQDYVADLSTNNVIQHIADINGDGKSEFIYNDKYEPTVSTMMDVNGDGYVDHIRYYHKWDYNIFVSYGSASGFIHAPELIRNFGKDKFDNVSFRFVDVDADGVVDMIAGKSGKGIYLSKGYKSSNGKLGGFNAFTQILTFKSGNIFSNVISPIKIADLNADGLPDILHFGESNTLVSYNDNGVFKPFEIMQKVGNKFSYSDGWRSDKHIRTLGDVNGDGLLDIIGFAEYEVRISLNTGTEFLPYYVGFNGLTYGNGGWRVDKNPRILADMNNDGKVDIVAFSNSSTRVYTSNGSKFNSSWSASIANFNSGWGSNDLRTVIDYNGDGTLDIVGVKKDGTTEVYIGDSQIEHITKFNNDTDQDITITYKSLTDKTIYTKGSSDVVTLFHTTNFRKAKLK